MCDLALSEPGGWVHRHEGSSSNKGWHQQWFYLRSDADAPLPPYTDRFFEEAPERWGYGPIAADRKRIDTLLLAVKRLVDADVTGAGVIVAFHERRLLPLMRRACRLDEMVLLAFLSTTTKNRITHTNSNGPRNDMVIINLSLLQ
jgi:hypothetical protein